MTNWSRKILGSFGFAALLVLPESAALAEALSTTSAGFGARSITYTSARRTDTTTTGTNVTNEQESETIQDPMICHRVSTPSNLGLELGAGGCVHGGGFWTFAHGISSHLQLIYYPLASRTQIDDDSSVRMRRQFFGDLFIVAQGGFAKVTHRQRSNTNVTLSMDVIEFGGGIGWSYRLFDNMAIGAEGTYLFGSILSEATTGSTNMIKATGTITVFL